MVGSHATMRGQAARSSTISISRLEQCSASPSASSASAWRPRQRRDRHLVPLLVQVPDDVERPDLAAPLGRERHPMADEQDFHARKSLAQAASGHPGGALPVEVQPAPDFEVDQRQQVIGAVGLLLLVLANRALHGIRIEQAAARHALARQHVAQHRRQFGTQPGAHRRAEAALLTMQDVVRQHAFERSLHHVLQLAAPHLERARHAGRQLDEPLVEQRHAAFERHRHAHLVGEQQQVVRQLRREIHVHQLAQRIVRLRIGKAAGDAVVERRPDAASAAAPSARPRRTPACRRGNAPRTATSPPA